MNYKYCIAIDVEKTTEGDEKMKEIIEIGAVALEISSNRIMNTFNSFVKPMRSVNMVLGDLCKQITGISQNTINNSDTMREVLPAFLEWIGQLKKNGIDTTTHGTDGNCCIVTWSNNDLRSLRNDLAAKNMKIPTIFNVGLDLQALFATQFARGKVVTLENAMQQVGLAFQGSPHSAKSDALNTASLAGYMASKGVSLNSNNIEKY